MTKSYNYIPTHFLYSSLLFFLLIFMYQQTHCHTLPKPFSQIFLFRIYVPTTYIHQPCLTLILPRPASGLHSYTRPLQPPQTNPPTTTAPQIPTQPPQTHAHTAPQTHTDTHTNARDAGPRRRCRRTAKRCRTPTLTVTQSQPPASPQLDRPSIRPDQAGLNQVRPGRTEPGQVSDRPHTGSD